MQRLSRWLDLSLEFRERSFYWRGKKTGGKFDGKIKLILSHVLSCFKASVCCSSHSRRCAPRLSSSPLPKFPLVSPMPCCSSSRASEGCHDHCHLGVILNLIQVFFFFFFCLSFITVLPFNFYARQYSCLEHPMRQRDISGLYSP